MSEGGSGEVAGRGPRSLLGPRLAAIFVVALAALLLQQALQIGSTLGYSPVGPTTIPLVVATVLLVLGVLLAARCTLAAAIDADLAERSAEEEVATHWPTVLITLGILAVYALALNGFRLGPLVVPGLGYVVATALFLPATARVLGSRHLLRDVIVGVGVAVVVYLSFTRFLGVRLPPGVLELIGL